jgi:hypothetical protein
VFLHLVGYAGHVVHSVRPGRETSTHYFHAYVGLVRIPKKKRTGTCYVEFVFLHPVGFVGHVVHSGASWVRNADPLFSLLG